MSSTPSNTPPLAKYLASTDKKTRDRAVKNLAVFLSEAPENALPKTEMDKLWKGIFYCFWMSDKPLVQQALANELAELILTITSVSASLAFLRGFWTTMVREWNGIDRLRIDKYYVLVRRFVNASFRLLIRTQWDIGACTQYNDILTSEGGPLCPSDIRAPTGLAYHLADIYLEELDKALATPRDRTPPPAPLGTLLEPFFTVMAYTNTSATFKRIQSSLLEPLLEALSPQHYDDELRSVKRQRREVDAYSSIISNACMENLRGSAKMDNKTLRRGMLRTVFEVASQPETKDSNRRKLYAIWKEGVDEEED